MATHVSAAPRKRFRSQWVPLLAALALVAMLGVAFAAGRGSAPTPSPARVPVQSNLGSQLAGMVPWMQNHTGDITWMQAHIGDVTWMRNHPNQWQWMQGHIGTVRWMQTHPTQWRWMQTHMGDIGWMHDHWGQWDRWRSSAGSGTGTWNEDNHQGGSYGPGDGWDCRQC